MDVTNIQQASKALKSLPLCLLVVVVVVRVPGKDKNNKKERCEKDTFTNTQPHISCFKSLECVRV